MNTLPAIIEPSKNITLVVLHNPFSLSDRTITTVETSIDLSLATFLEQHAPIGGEQEYHASINGKVYAPEEMGNVFVVPGDYVVVCPVLRGGGGRSKNPLAILAGIALAVVSFGVSTAVTAAYG
ncbi:MAG: hypothetical protein LBQ42_00600, partial [Synergistaceae bacterium]|nr:hypothetical protein [Synergistaceae bacterium]